MNFSECLERIADSARSKRLSVWAGAGISLRPPAGLPLSRDLKSYILEQLCSQSSLRELYQDRLQQRMDIGKKLEAYPLEAFIERISENYDIVGTIAEVFRCGSPNLNHLIIAKLMTKGCVRQVLTTNLDLLIEAALISLGWTRKHNFAVYCSEEEFSRIASDLPAVFKIHGSADDEESIRITLSQVSSRMLSQSRAGVLEHFLCSDNGEVLILGYSASDEFDINPALSRLSPKRNIFFVKHEGQLSQPRIEELPTAFHNFEGNTILCRTEQVIDYLQRAVLYE